MTRVTVAEPADEPTSRPAISRLPARLPVLATSAVGDTELSAFHRALASVGLGRYNLLRLSSVIPAHTVVGEGRAPRSPDVHPGFSEGRPYDFVEGSWGDRVFCVYAERRAQRRGEEAWAGVGWVQREDGAGYFVEHDGPSAEAVEELLQKSLADVVRDEPDSFLPARWSLSGVRCEDRPVCALVIAPYVAVAW